jgi:peptidoglycan-associated lipoprotein
LKTTTPDQEASATDEAVAPFDLSSIVGQDWKEIPPLAAVPFDFDQAALSPEARSIVATNAKWLKAYPRVEVRVAGHCDDRGTIEYNIALGQRRARVVRDTYKALGIAESRLSTISFGEERPVCLSATEDCWAKNRRAETGVRLLSPEGANPTSQIRKGRKSEAVGQSR